MGVALINIPQAVIVDLSAIGGSGWIGYCPVSREAVLVNVIREGGVLDAIVNEERLQIVASLGTELVPPPKADPAPASRYSDMLARLGLASAEIDLDGRRIGPMGGWGGTPTISVDGQVATLDPSATADWVVTATHDAHYAERVRSVVVRFGECSARCELAGGGSLVWRIGDTLLRASRRVEVGGDAHVAILDPNEVAELRSPVVLDVEPDGIESPLLIGARRVGPRFDPDALGLDGTHQIVLVSEHGRSCAPAAMRLARLGFDVIRIEGGTRAWMRAGLPTSWDLVPNVTIPPTKPCILP